MQTGRLLAVAISFPFVVGCGGGGGPGNADGGPEIDAPVIAPEPLSAFIVVDQFGYRPDAEKVAVIRSPRSGFDAGEAFEPGASYALVDATTGARVLTAAPAAWNGGAEDSSSGDAAWRFDFSSASEPGVYYVLDVDRAVRSDVFAIRRDVYADTLEQAVRVLYYQRDGFAKEAQYAGAAWADGPAHLGAGQGPDCGLYQQGATRKDVQGGWWDAGDQNKYTNWGDDYVIELLRAYRDRPAAFGDDYNIPESGNGVPDLLDEVRFQLAWLVRMQNPDGSVHSIVGQDGASLPNPLPSTATGPCTYGPVSTSASYSTAGAFALAAAVFQPFDAGFAADLASRAESAWTWAEANPGRIFYNAGTGVGAGEQEVDDHGRVLKRLQAAVFLFALTGDATYRAAVDADYDQVGMIASNYVDLFMCTDQENLLDYATTPGATGAVADDIMDTFRAGVGSGNNLGALAADPDPYLAHLYVYVWGSNQSKAQQGNVLYDVVTYGVDPSREADAARAAERFVHYVHGVNPFGLVYLSNMGEHGAARSVTRFYHTWFMKGSAWDAVGESEYGPPPGYLVGGPNPSYDWDGCCPDGCSGFSCGPAVLSPPANQPPQKSYAEFNDGWPLNSWSVTEPSLGYQTKYIRLLSRFVER
jgi:endoglucanase